MTSYLFRVRINNGAANRGERRRPVDPQREPRGQSPATMHSRRYVRSDRHLACAYAKQTLARRASEGAFACVSRKNSGPSLALRANVSDHRVDRCYTQHIGVGPSGEFARTDSSMTTGIATLSLRVKRNRLSRPARWRWPQRLPLVLIRRNHKNRTRLLQGTSL